jgi:DNA processing protein
MAERKELFWVWLAEALGPKNRDFRHLMELYENPYELFQADDSEIERITDISLHTRAALYQKDLGAATQILTHCQKSGIGILSFGDPAYPYLLKELPEPPIVLYYCGTLPDFNKQLCIAMVGTRRMSAYGMQTAYKIAYELASTETIVVSGMAAGIDGVCAAAAIAAKGKTVAVLGCGIDVVYPKHHKKLMQMVQEHGAVLSEYPPKTKPVYYHFPTRNRIISGLSQGTVVVEASIGSGSLITAKDAITQGRDVFALPANVDFNGAEGTNRLLRDGANLVLDTMDILKKYEYIYANTLKTENLIRSRKESRADLHYLDRIGVIELTQKKTDPPSSKDASAKQESTEPKKERRGSVKKTEAPTASKDSASEEFEQLQIQLPEEIKKEEKKASAPDEVISSLSPVQLAILQAIPDDRSVTADHLCSLGHPHGEVIAALTMLEIMGLIQKLPGALYTKV